MFILLLLNLNIDMLIWITGSLSRSPDLAAMMGVGSFYATPESETTYEVGKIIPGERTQSFTKKSLG